MNFKPAGIFAMGIAVGFVAATIVYRDGVQEPSVTAAWSDAPADRFSPNPIDVEFPGPESASAEGDVSLSLPPSTASDTPADSDATERFRVAARRRQVDKLLAAGFTMDRVEWMMRRVTELRAERERLFEDRRQRGLPPDPESFVSLIDDDIGLRKEMGDAEYERYRLALGRPVGAPIEQVLPGSIAESVGLRAGDEVISYAGKRIFNGAELNLLLDEGSGGDLISVEVRRDGQVLHMVIPKGPLGIRHALVSPFFLGGAPNRTK